MTLFTNDFYRLNLFNSLHVKSNYPIKFILLETQRPQTIS